MLSYSALLLVNTDPSPLPPSPPPSPAFPSPHNYVNSFPRAPFCVFTVALSTSLKVTPCVFHVKGDFRKVHVSLPSVVRFAGKREGEGRRAVTPNFSTGTMLSEPATPMFLRTLLPQTLRAGGEAGDC